MHEVWRDLVLRQLRVKWLSTMCQEVDMRLARVMPVKHNMAELMLALNESETNTEAISLHMHQGHT